MGMSHGYTGAGSDDDESIRTIHRALDLGVTLIDTAEVYGPYINEELVGRAIAGPPRPGRAGHQVRADLPHRTAGRRQQPGQHPGGGRGVAAPARHRPHRPLLPAPRRPEHADRGDRRRPRRAGRGPGKVRHIGLSEAWIDTIRRAHAVHPITALQSEYSLWTRDQEEVLPRAARARDRSRALLAARPRLPHRRNPLPRGPRRRRLRARTNPRFTGENFQRNLALADEVQAVAAEVGATPAQVALAWLLARGDRHRPHPGHQAGRPGRGERRRRRRRAHRRAAAPPRRPRPGRGRAPHRGADAAHRALSRRPGNRSGRARRRERR